MQPTLTIPMWSLLAMVAWTMALVIAITLYRNGQVSLGKKQPNEFPSGVPHGPDWYWRLNRAHVNCVENLPLFASVVLIAHLVKVGNLTLDALSVVYVLARIFQTTVHVAGNTPLSVRLRFLFFVVQLAVVITYSVVIAQAGLAPFLDQQRALH